MAIAVAKLLPEVVAAVEAASAAVLAVYNTAFTVRAKADESPVTEADLAGERIIMPRLQALLPDVPVISEEAQAGPHAIATVGSCFWLVDPLDGTKEFVARSGDFTVNVALVEDGRPTLGVVSIPAMGTIYTGAGPGTAHGGSIGGPLRPIAARKVPADGVVVLSSRSHDNSADIEAFLKTYKVAARQPVGSSLKFCRIAEGAADLYPRFGPTSEWDIAAGQAVLEAAGGTVTTFDGAPMRYGKKGFLNPGFVARGRM
ncbi:MAG: 3'(2'),5'-bisphosphate nucleotidase CysQ [Gemmatimonas sp.]